MKKLLLAAFGFLPFFFCYSQSTINTTLPGNPSTAAFIKRESGNYNDPQHKTVVGTYTILYAIDTSQHELLTVSSTSKDRHGEMIYLFYYLHNKLVKSSSGVVQNGYTVIQNSYDYDMADYKISSADLEAFSATDEKYALLKESRKYLQVLQKL